jgi:hypothetical protein
MSVEQYSARFMELAKFVANLIPDEESKAERLRTVSTLESKNESYASRLKTTPG